MICSKCKKDLAYLTDNVITVSEQLICRECFKKSRKNGKAG